MLTLFHSVSLKAKHMTTNKFLVADDHAIVRTGLKTVIKELHPFAQVEEAAEGDTVTALVKKNDYDMLILDINMPGTDAMTLICNLLAHKEKTKILVFSMNSEILYAKRLFKLGVLGYLDKEAPAEEIRNAIESVLSGQLYMSPDLKKYLYEDMLTKKTDDPFEKLSNREIQIAKYLLLGYSVSEISTTLNLHSSTIGTHKLRFFEKLKVKNVFELEELAKLYQLDPSKI
jgi:two-component system, NarL family, invasion response regulator UvrY